MQDKNVMEKIRSSAGFLLIDKNRKFILQHRDEKIKRFPGYWAFFGGKMEARETPEKCVRREAKEELGIKLEDLKFIKSYKSKQREEEQFIFIVSLKIPLEKLKKQQKEGQDLGLFSYREIKKIKIPSFEKSILKNLFRKNLIA